MNLFKKKRIFLDHAAGRDNPSAIYEEGVEAKKRLEEARTKVARLLHVQARDVIFASGGTESDNLSILGVFEAHRTNPPAGGKKPHIIISSLEHPAILESAKEVEKRGGEVTIIEADEEGLISPVEVAKAIKENTILVSIVYANGEIGTVQPISKIGRLINEHKKKSESTLPYFHTDATQAYQYLNTDISALHVDMMTLESVLVVRPPVKIHPIIFGGGQERGLRSGTEDLEAIEKFVHHFARALQERERESARLYKLREYFIEGIKDIPNIIINGSEEHTLPDIVSVSLPNTLHEFLAIKLDQKGVAVSTGSSCRSIKSEEEQEAIRFSFGRETTESELKSVIQIFQSLC